MKIKLHFGVLVVLIAFLGTFLESSTMPNQQIVIQFLDKDITHDTSESAIESVKKQLRSIGAALIEINKNEDGQLVITYYSETNVELIQNILNQANDFKLTNDSGDNGATNLPESKTVKAYKLDISEIKNNNPINWSFERTEIVELNHKSDASNSFKVNSSAQNFDENPIVVRIKVAQQNNLSVIFTIDEQSYKIPEVRAGPHFVGMS